MKSNTFRSWLLLPVCLMIAAMMLHPEKTVAAASSALMLWAQVVVPSLLPFFMLAELMVALGGAELAGRRLAPLMRPLFNLPGAASLGVVMGFCSGFPTGAAVAASLRREDVISAEEGGRLLAFTNNAGPLYVTVAVASGLLQCPQAAPVLAVGHYGINLLLGIILGLLHRLRTGRRGASTAPGSPRSGSVPGAPLAVLMKAAAQRAAANLILIGCYMAFFAVAAEMLTPSRLSDGSPLVKAALSGIWEMSLGVNALADSSLSANLLLPLVSAQLAFGGLSVQMQVLAMAADTDISPRLYLLCRPLHALLAALFTRWALGRMQLSMAASGSYILPVMPGSGALFIRSLMQAAVMILGLLLIALLWPKPAGRERG